MLFSMNSMTVTHAAIGGLWSCDRIRSRKYYVNNASVYMRQAQSKMVAFRMIVSTHAKILCRGYLECHSISTRLNHEGKICRASSKKPTSNCIA